VNRNAWLTPDAPIEPGKVCRVLRIPIPFEKHVMGALGELCEAYNWEAAGDMTVADCAAAMWDMWQSIEGCIMIGSVAAFATTTLPDNYLLCDGAEYDREDYPALYAVLGAAYIIDADTFTVPSLENRVVVGAGDVYSVGDEGGAADVTLAVSELPAHDHVYQEKSEILFPYGTLTPQVSARGTLFESGRDTSETGEGDAHENMPPFCALLWGICYR